MKEEVQIEANYIKLEGGEIPEVYFWNSYFWLTEKPPKGLGLNLTPKELNYLKKAVLERYLYIIKRDLTYKKIGSPCYRGIDRALVNLQRLKNFLRKNNFNKKTWNLVQVKLQKWLTKFKKDLEKNGYQAWLNGETLKNLEKALGEDL